MKIYVDAKKYCEYLKKIAKRIENSKDYVTELDSITGDGDHWANINIGFQKLAENADKLSNMKLSEMFKNIGMIIMSASGGSSGVLYGSAFIRAAKTVGDEVEMDINLLCKVYESQLEAIMERGNAKPGYKTMIDTLYPAVEKFKKALMEGKDDWEALKAFKEGAIQGMNSTKDMEAVRGRACYQANKGKGHIDPGAVTMCYQIEELVDFLCNEMI